MVENLSSFEILHTNMDEMWVNASVSLPSFKMTGNYSVKAKKERPFLPIPQPPFATGTFLAHPHDIVVNVTAKFTPAEKSNNNSNNGTTDKMRLAFFDYSVTIGEVIIEFMGNRNAPAGLRSGINNFLSRVGPGIFRKVEERGHDRVRADLEARINQALEVRKDELVC